MFAYIFLFMSVFSKTNVILSLHLPKNKIKKTFDCNSKVITKLNSYIKSSNRALKDKQISLFMMYPNIRSQP